MEKSAKKFAAPLTNGVNNFPSASAEFSAALRSNDRALDSQRSALNKESVNRKIQRSGSSNSI